MKFLIEVKPIMIPTMLIAIYVASYLFLVGGYKRQ